MMGKWYLRGIVGRVKYLSQREKKIVESGGEDRITTFRDLKAVM